MPATSVNITRPWRSVSRRALDLPKPIALPPPDCIWRMKKIQMPTNSSIGNHEMKMLSSGLPVSSGAALKRTFFSVSFWTSDPSFGFRVLKARPSEVWPETVLPWMVTSATCPDDS